MQRVQRAEGKSAESRDERRETRDKRTFSPCTDSSWFHSFRALLQTRRVPCCPLAWLSLSLSLSASSNRVDSSLPNAKITPSSPPGSLSTNMGHRMLHLFPQSPRLAFARLGLVASRRLDRGAERGGTGDGGLGSVLLEPVLDRLELAVLAQGFSQLARARGWRMKTE